MAASAESLQAEQVVFTIPSAYAVQTNSVGAIVWDPEIMAPLLRVRFGLDCDPQDLNLPRPRRWKPAKRTRGRVMPILIISKAACRT